VTLEVASILCSRKPRLPLSVSSRVLCRDRGGACASHHGEAWPWGPQQSTETRLRDAGRRYLPASQVAWAVCWWEAGARVRVV